MALVITPMSKNASRVEATCCPAVLIVSGVAPRLLASLVEGVEKVHCCA